MSDKPDDSTITLRTIYLCETHPKGIQKELIIKSFFQDDEETWGYLINLFDSTSFNSKLKDIHEDMLAQNIWNLRFLFCKDLNLTNTIGAFRFSHYVDKGYILIDIFQHKNLTSDKEIIEELLVLWTKLFDIYEQILDEAMNVKRDLIKYGADNVDLEIVDRFQIEFLDFKENKYNLNKMTRRIQKKSQSQNVNEKNSHQDKNINKTNSTEYADSLKEYQERILKANYSEVIEYFMKKSKKITENNEKNEIAINSQTNHNHNLTNEQQSNEKNAKEIYSTSVGNSEQSPNNDACHLVAKHQTNSLLIEVEEPIPCCQKCNIFQIMLVGWVA